MSLGSDYLGSSGTRAPSSWRRACTPGTFLKTLRARNSRQKQKDKENENPIEEPHGHLGESCIDPRVVDYGRLYYEDILGNSTASSGCRSGGSGAAGCSDLPGVDRNARWHGKCGDQGPGDRISTDAELSGRLVRQKRTAAVRDRPALVSGCGRTGTRSARAGEWAISAIEGAVGAGQRGTRKRGSQSA